MDISVTVKQISNNTFITNFVPQSTSVWNTMPTSICTYKGHLATIELSTSVLKILANRFTVLRVKGIAKH